MRKKTYVIKMRKVKNTRKDLRKKKLLKSQVTKCNYEYGSIQLVQNT